MIRRSCAVTALGAALTAVLPAAALAHATGDVGGGFVSGLTHPIFGLDHLVAMVAVGVWGAQLGMPMKLALPLAFPLMMAVGALLGMAGAPLPGLELGVSLSAVALGVAVFLNWRPSQAVAVALVAVFAAYHGHAHGGELDPSASPAAYSAGFLLMTGLLHLAGIGVGELARALREPALGFRVAGGAVAAVGALFTASNLAAL